MHSTYEKDFLKNMQKYVMILTNNQKGFTLYTDTPNKEEALT